MPLRLRTNLFVALALTALPMVVVLVISMAMWSASEHKVAETNTFATARLLNFSLGAMIEESQRDLEGLADDATIDWSLRGQTLARLATYATRYPFAHGISWIDTAGLRVANEPELRISVADRSWFRQAVAQRRFTIGEFVVSRLTGAPSIPLVQPVLSQGKLKAVLAMSIDLAWYSKQIEEQVGSTGTSVTLANDQGIVLVRYPSAEQYLGLPFPNAQVAQTALSGQEVAQQFVGLDGTQRLFSVVPLRLVNKVVGFVAVGIPAAQIHRGTELVQFLAWGGLLLVVVVSIFILVFGLRRFVLRPVAHLVDSTGRLAHGEFSERIDSRRLPPELSVLATSINSMASSLEVRERELRDYQEHLEDMVHQRTAQLEASREELSRSNADLQQFAYVASHDLQEPLRMVASFTQLLERKYSAQLDQQGLQYIAFAVDGARRMQQLINDLLAYSRVETRAKDFAAFEGSEPVELALKNLQLLIEDKGAVVEVQTLPRLWGDLGQLTQVFQNLIANGLKFNRSQPPRVTISAQDNAQAVTITVADNGIGIDESVGERIFVLFQRLNPRSEFEGTGIGLAVCKRIVEKHGGKIWLEPNDEAGSRFRFTLRKRD